MDSNVFKKSNLFVPFFHLMNKAHKNTVLMMMMAPQFSPNSGTACLAAATANREMGKRTELV